MTPLFTMLLLPLRAPMLLLLLLISIYLGLYWSRPGVLTDADSGGITALIWSAECAQALVVVLVCTMPDLLLRRLASMMAASRVVSLVVTLLLVITGGLYLLHLEVLSNVLILASAVLLARLDLVRLRVVPPPFVMTVVLSVLVLAGVSLGRSLEAQLHPWLLSPPEQRRPARESRPPARPGDATTATPEPLPPPGEPAVLPAAAAAEHRPAGPGSAATAVAAGPAGPAAARTTTSARSPVVGQATPPASGRGATAIATPAPQH
ncbi:MAG: hypothetical protein VKJ44_02600 [Synechococcus sp.]|nr:hypothetical protein [Synechococcus sp.]